METRGRDVATRFRFLGVIFGPDRLPMGPSLTSHVSNPTPLHLGGSAFRVFFASRDNQKRSSLSFFDFDIASRTVINVADEPLFSFGPSHTFFSHGVSPGSLYQVDGRLRLAFMGWSIPGIGEHWRGEIGLLNLDKFGLKASLHSEEPLFGRGEENPISLSYPEVIAVGNRDYLMIYGSTLTWDAGNGEMLHVLKAARSSNGIDWRPIGSPHPYALGNEQAFSSPSVVRVGEHGYDVFFSYRGGPPSKYRIGRSHFDLRDLSWRRLPDPVISGLDARTIGSEMQEYPSIFIHEGCTYMLFNGDGFGRTGVGLAVAE